MDSKDNCRHDGILCFHVEDCKILHFYLGAVQKWGFDKEQIVEIITFLLFHAKQTVHTSLVK